MNLKPLRIAMIEPNEADVYWFRLSAKEVGLPIEEIHYSTGVIALNEWAKRADWTPDLIVVAAVLPMLTLREFVDAARTLHPYVPVAVAGEQTLLPELDGVEWYAKPLSPDDIRQMCRFEAVKQVSAKTSRATTDRPSTFETEPCYTDTGPAGEWFGRVSKLSIGDMFRSITTMPRPRTWPLRICRQQRKSTRAVFNVNRLNEALAEPQQPRAG